MSTKIKQNNIVIGKALFYLNRINGMTIYLISPILLPDFDKKFLPKLNRCKLTTRTWLIKLKHEYSIDI